MRSHHELDINREGINVKAHLLKRINLYKHELRITQNRSKLFERED